MCTSSPIANIAILAIGGALTGGALAAFAPALASASGLASLGAGAASTFAGGSFVAATAIGAGIAGAGVGLLAASSQGQQQAQVQQQAPQESTDVTGSGGRNAPRVLAAKIRQVNRKSTEPQIDPSSANLQPTAGTGLQLA